MYGYQSLRSYQQDPDNIRDYTSSWGSNFRLVNVVIAINSNKTGNRNKKSKHDRTVLRSNYKSNRRQLQG